MLKLVNNNKLSRVASPRKASISWLSGTGYGYANKIFALLGYNSSISLTRVYFNALLNLKDVLSLVAASQKLFEHKEDLFRGQSAFFIKHKYYKGMRYLKKLPVRGQRTHTNAQTARFVSHIESTPTKS